MFSFLPPFALSLPPSVDEIVSLPPSVFLSPDGTISWRHEAGRLTRGLFVAEEDEGKDDRVGRTAMRKGGVYLRGIFMRRGFSAAVWWAGDLEVVRLLFVCLVAALLIMPDTGESSLLAGWLICIRSLLFGLEL